MNKKVVALGVIGIFAFIFFSSYKTLIHSSKHSNQDIKVLADERLSLAAIKKRVETKIDFILENISHNDAILTTKELQSLIEEISIIRAYGRDISKEAKKKLLDIIDIANKKDSAPNKTLLKKLEEIAITSQSLAA
jgi:GTP cyclohydrolase FolE2